MADDDKGSSQAQSASSGDVNKAQHGPRSTEETGSKRSTSRGQGRSRPRGGVDTLERHIEKEPRESGRDAAYGEWNPLAPRHRNVEEERGDDAPVDLADVVTIEGVKYTPEGHLVSDDGRRVARSGDAFDVGVGWTAQHLALEEPVNPFHDQESAPDQTFHPAELPDPIAALRAGLLPQNTVGLNIDPEKFENLKPLDV